MGTWAKPLLIAAFLLAILAGFGIAMQEAASAAYTCSSPWATKVAHADNQSRGVYSYCWKTTSSGTTDTTDIVLLDSTSNSIGTATLTEYSYGDDTVLVKGGVTITWESRWDNIGTDLLSYTVTVGSDYHANSVGSNTTWGSGTGDSDVLTDNDTDIEIIHILREDFDDTTVGQGDPTASCVWGECCRAALARRKSKCCQMATDRINKCCTNVCCWGCETKSDCDAMCAPNLGDFYCYCERCGTACGN